MAEISVISKSTAGYSVDISSTSTGLVIGSTGLYFDYSGYKDSELGLYVKITSTATGDGTVTLLAGDYWRKGVGNFEVTIPKPGSGNEHSLIKLEESARFLDEDDRIYFDVSSSDLSVVGFEYP